MTADSPKSDTNPEPDSPDAALFVAQDWRSPCGAMIEARIDPAFWPDDLIADLGQRGPLMLDHLVDLLSIDPPFVSLLLCGDDEMRVMNHQHRGFDKSTNVLSFPAYDGAAGGDWPAVPETFHGADIDPSIGDIAIAGETVQREAAAAHVSTPDHLLHLFTHGVLHLLGYDHIDEAMADEMETLEIRVLASMNVANPYDDAAYGSGTREAG